MSSRRKSAIVRRRASDDAEPAPQVPPPSADAPEAPRTPTPQVVHGSAIARPKGRQLHREDRDTPSRPADVPTGLSSLEALLQGGEIDMGALVDASPRPSVNLDPGTRLTGHLLRHSGTEWAVDLGLSVEGWIAADELPTGAAPGDEIAAFVLSADDGGIQLSQRLSGPAAATFLEEAVESSIPVEGQVVATHKAGFDVRIGPVRAFMPFSQASRLPLQDPSTLVGTSIEVRVLETGDRTVVSRRAIEEDAVEASRARRLLDLEEGDVVEAVVTSVQPWGAFLDVDGVDLRLPKREFDWEEPADLTTRLDRGQRLRVRVISKEDGGRITVSSRDPDLDPWNDAVQRWSEGQVVEGTVTSLTDFGVFVRLAPGLDGLVHDRWMSRRPEIGHRLEVRILQIDASRRRIGLAPADAPVEEAADWTEQDRERLGEQDEGSMGTLGDLFRASLKR